MTENTPKKKKTSFFIRQRNTIVACVIVFAVLLGGYFVVREALSDDETPTTDAPTTSLLPGEVVDPTGATLLYPSVARKDLKEVRIHNNKLDPQYQDWGMSFAYDKNANDYYGFLSDYNGNVVVDETKLAYFAAAVGSPIFSTRIDEHCTDFAPYGLTEEEAIRVEVELTNGTVYTVYFGKKNPSGTGYYVRSMDEAVDGNGNLCQRDSVVYLLNSTVSSYFEVSVLEKPAAMLNTLLTNPVNTVFYDFFLGSYDESLLVQFKLLDKVDSAELLFGSSSVYYSVTPPGYFSSWEFESLISRFESFAGLETMEYATKLVTETDEDGEEYSYYTFEAETLAKYGIDLVRPDYTLMYQAGCEGVDIPVQSAVMFSALQPDGYYYAYSLCFDTIVKVDPSTVDFLTWETLDFFNSLALCVSIGYCEQITLSGKIDGVPYSQTFTAQMTEMENDDSNATGPAMYRVTNAFSESLGKEVNMESYRTLFQEIYSTMLWERVPDADRVGLLDKEPYLEISVKTPRVTLYENGKISGALESVTRVLRFYQYSNGRAMMTVEMIDANGNSGGESGEFYVRVAHLDKLIGDAKKLCEGIPFSAYDKE